MIEFAALPSVSTLFGGTMLYSFVFAPMVFSALPTDDAGRFHPSRVSLVLFVRYRSCWLQ